MKMVELSSTLSNFPEIAHLKQKYAMQVSSLEEAVHNYRNNLAHALRLIKQGWDSEQ